jgi:hypothetical protein
MKMGLTYIMGVDSEIYGRWVCCDSNVNDGWIDTNVSRTTGKYQHRTRRRALNVLRNSWSGRYNGSKAKYTCEGLQDLDEHVGKLDVLSRCTRW